MAGNERRGLVIQERDKHLLSEIEVMRIIDREMARIVAPFGSVTRANARLLALTEAGLLRRNFQGTASAGKKALYMLSSSGARLVGASSTGPKRKRDELLVGDLFVEHQSLINELYCKFKYGTTTLPGISFRRWLAFSAPLEHGMPLVPDGYVEFDCPGKSLAAFIEVDLGQERLSVWRKKVRNYLQFAISGHFEERFGKKRFLVLAVAESRKRLESLRVATAGLTDMIFRFVTFSSINQDGIWSPIWLSPVGKEPQALVKPQ